jgi:hypothetical protein
LKLAGASTAAGFSLSEGHFDRAENKNGAGKDAHQRRAPHALRRRVIVHLTFVTSGVLLALADLLSAHARRC